MPGNVSQSVLKMVVKSI